MRKSPASLLVLLAATAWTLPSQIRESLLARYVFSDDSGHRQELPGALQEISGLASTPDGRVFAHNDERAVVYQIDPSTGEQLKAFSVGRIALGGDFEGIAIAEDRFFLITSAGTLVEFREGEASSSVPYELHNLGLRDTCELEGLAFDPEERTLLLPCKTPRREPLEDHLVVFSLSLETMRVHPTPRFLIPLEDLDDRGLGKNFHPSAIEVYPETRSVLIVAAREEALVELSADGEILATEELKRRNHPQPEGVAFLPNGSLLLADEGQGERGTLSLYEARVGEGGADR